MLISAIQTISRTNQLFFQYACNVAARIVMRCVGNIQRTSFVDQAIAREAVAQGCMVVLTLGRQIKSAILTNAIVSKGTHRGGIYIQSLVKLHRSCAG